MHEIRFHRSSSYLIDSCLLFVFDFNSDALNALPYVKNEHHHFSSAHTNIIHHRANHKDTHSTDALTNGASNGSSSNQDDVRPVAIVHGKKNRLAYGHDDESVSSGSKRFCVSNGRENESDAVSGRCPRTIKLIAPNCKR